LFLPPLVSCHGVRRSKCRVSRCSWDVLQRGRCVPNDARENILCRLSAKHCSIHWCVDLGQQKRLPVQRRLFRASLPWLQHLLHARCQCRAVSTRVGYWRHDGLNGFSCFPCPEGAECKVRSSVFALEAPVRLRVRGCLGHLGEPRFVVPI